VRLCPECGKVCYSTRRYARRAGRTIFPGRRLRVYQCGDYWHHTSADAEVTASLREKNLSPTVQRRLRRKRAASRGKLQGLV
jgi:hypothetical protein